jgi:hypothetical protein
VITYAVNGAQKVAVATGYASPVFPAEIRRAKIAILGDPDLFHAGLDRHHPHRRPCRFGARFGVTGDLPAEKTARGLLHFR